MAIVNPLNQALIRSRTKPNDLSRILGVSRQYISRAQKGCPITLSGPIIRWIHEQLRGDYDNLTQAQIQAWYQWYKNDKRLYNLENYLLEFPQFPYDSSFYRSNMTYDPPKGSISFINKVYLDSLPVAKFEKVKEAYNHPPKKGPTTYEKLRSPLTTREAMTNWRRKYFETPYAFGTEFCINVASIERFESGESKEMPDDLRIFISWLRYVIDKMENLPVSQVADA